jgi:hypothetical protein
MRDKTHAYALALRQTAHSVPAAETVSHRADSLDAKGGPHVPDCLRDDGVDGGGRVPREEFC